jgi:transcriptional regulator with XRE-family HTH domain
MPATGDNRLGEYLRARRALVSPANAGLPETAPGGGGARRRVRGLRREELALLAGISNNYYVRLEQGRDRRPSPSVLAALARALRLDAHATAHLLALAAHGAAGLAEPGPDAPEPAAAPPALAAMIATWPRTPALIQSAYGDVLAANPLAVALSPLHRPGVNGTRATFLDPVAREVYRDDWDRVARSVVSGLRAQGDPDDPRVRALVDELLAGSAEFRTLWARHDVRPREGGGTSRIHHPTAGLLVLRFEKLAVTGTRGQTLVAYHGDDLERLG